MQQRPLQKPAELKATISDAMMNALTYWNESLITALIKKGEKLPEHALVIAVKQFTEEQDPERYKEFKHFLLTKGASMTACDPDTNDSVLHFYARFGHANHVRTYLECYPRVNVDKKNDEELTPFLAALDVLTEHSPDFSHSNITKVLQLLLPFHANYDNYFALAFACRNLNLLGAQVLMNELQFRPCNAHLHQVMIGFKELEKEAQQDFRDDAIALLGDLMSKGAENDDQIAQFIEELNCNADFQCRLFDMVNTEELKDYKAFMHLYSQADGTKEDNICDVDGNTLLHMTAENNMLTAHQKGRVLKLLLDSGHSVEDQNNEGETVLDKVRWNAGATFALTLALSQACKEQKAQTQEYKAKADALSSQVKRQESQNAQLKLKLRKRLLPKEQTTDICAPAKLHRFDQDSSVKDAKSRFFAKEGKAENDAAPTSSSNAIRTL